MTIDSVKNKLNDYLGESVIIKCNLGRNKYEKYAATIKKLYNNVFIVETNKHHIIPRSWFKLHNKDVDNGLSNLVTLTYRDHVLAHYYLCLCTEDEFQFANQLALILLTTTKNKLNN